jgi:hypothetical protein
LLNPNPVLTKKDRQAIYQGLEQVRRLRIENVRRLMAQFDRQTDFAKAIAQSEAFVSQIAGENPSRNIGEALARDIERCIGLPQGWLDEQH